MYFNTPTAYSGSNGEPQCGVNSNRCQTCNQLLPGRSMPKQFFRKIQLACSEVSFLLLEINLLLKFDFLLKYEAYPIK